MSPSDPQPPTEPAPKITTVPGGASRHRVSAFLAACRQCAARPDHVIALHPEARAIQEQQSRTAALTVTAMLLRELEETGGQLVVDRRGARSSRPARTLAGLDYYRNRRALTRAGPIAAAAAELPRLWRRVLGLSAAELKQLASRVGASLIGTAVSCATPRDCAEWLRRLPASSRAELMALPAGAEETLAEPAARRLGGSLALDAEEVCAELGLALLSGVFSGLDQRERRLLPALSVTNVTRVLGAIAPMALDAEQTRAAERLIELALDGEVGPGRPDGGSR